MFAIPRAFSQAFAASRFAFAPVARLIRAVVVAASLSSTFALAIETIEVSLDGVVFTASIEPNRELLKVRHARQLSGSRTAQPQMQDRAIHFRGKIDGYEDSAVRLSQVNGYWRGVVIYNGEVRRVEQRQLAGEAFAPLIASRPLLPDGAPQMCQTPHAADGSAHSSHGHGSFASSGLSRDSFAAYPAPEIATLLPDINVSAATVSSACPDPVDGVCLLPELEMAYDLSYQAIVSPGETVLDRATRELNELELFFERSFNYRFSRVTMTFLDASQDAPFASESSPLDLLDALRVARNLGSLSYIQSPRSIFHFVTGRNFPSVNSPPDSDPTNDINVVGIAYLDVFCETFGLNTGLTDAGDAFLVSLVMAHEIGHNLGAEHDDPSANGCSVNTHVMTPSIGAGAALIDEFSSCSVATVEQTMANTLAGFNRSQCLDFPVDLEITAEPANVSEPPRDTPFNSVFDVTRAGGSYGVTSATVQGSIGSPANGRFRCPEEAVA